MGQALGCVSVKQSTVAIQESFGKFEKILDPGFHCVPWCCGRSIAGSVTLRLQQRDVRCETKTKDDVFVTVVASIQYKALSGKAYDVFYKLTNTKQQIQAHVFNVIRAKIPTLVLADAFVQKNDIANDVKQELEKEMSKYGYEMVQILIVDIEHDAHVKQAMINAESKNHIARQRQTTVDCLSNSVQSFSNGVPGTSARDAMDMVLATQYFDTMKEISAESNLSSVFIPRGLAAVRDIALQIRDGLLQVQGTPSASAPNLL